MKHRFAGNESHFRPGTSGRRFPMFAAACLAALELARRWKEAKWLFYDLGVEKLPDDKTGLLKRTNMYAPMRNHSTAGFAMNA